MARRYRVTARLDEGGTSTIYAAQDRRGREQVALKILSSELSTEAHARARFRAEGETLAQLQHPHIVRLLDDGTTDSGQPFLVLELLRGETLRARMQRLGRLDARETAAIVRQVAAALTTVHGSGLVHRDVKPANTFVTTLVDGQLLVKLLDFGICRDLKAPWRESRERLLVGTPEYMAPEQASGWNDLVDERTDQHALALLAYEMLTGVKPFSGGDLKHVLGRVRSRRLPPPSSFVPTLPREVDNVLLRALSKSKEERFGDVGEFAHQLDAALIAPAVSAAEQDTFASEYPRDSEAPPSKAAVSWLPSSMDRRFGADLLDVASSRSEPSDTDHAASTVVRPYH